MQQRIIHQLLIWQEKFGMRIALLLGVGGVAALVSLGVYLFRPVVALSSEAGIITVYTALAEDEADRYLQDFKLVFPEIEVNLVRQPINQLTERLYAEKEAPVADVIWGVALRNLLLLEWDDQLTPYAPLGSERIKSRFIDSRTPPYWVGFYLSPTAFCVNNDAAARRGLPPPQSWRDLIKPIYRRSLVMPNPQTSSAGLTVLMTIFELYDEQDAWRYLDELDKNIGYYSDDDGEPCQMVSRGEYPFAFASTNTPTSGVQMVYPREGLGWEIKVGALVRKKTIQPAARTFLDWAVSKSVMPLYARQSPLTAMETGAVVPLDFPDDAEARLLKLDPSWGAANRSRILREWQRRYGDKGTG